MVKIEFCSSKGKLTGFEISGHSGYADEGSDIICASISSCAYMVVNTITDIVHLDANVLVNDGYMKVMLDSNDAAKVQDLLRGFELHAKELAKDYRNFIRCNTKTIQ